MAYLSKYGRQDVARTHDEARGIVWCVCGRKPKKNKTLNKSMKMDKSMSKILTKL